MLYNLLLYFLHNLRLLRSKLYKLKNARFLLERIPFLFKKCPYEPEEYEYSDSLENYYLYNAFSWEFMSAWLDHLCEPIETNTVKVWISSWYRSTFTWLRYLTSYRSSRFTTNFFLSFFTKYFWCTHFTLDLNNFYTILMEFVEEFIDDIFND